MDSQLALELLRLVEGLVIVFGAIVIYFALKSGRRSGSRSLILLALGFAFVVAGAGVAGLLFEVNGLDLPTVQVTQAASQAVCFFIIVYSLMISKE